MNTLFNHFGTAFLTGWTWAFEQLPFLLGLLFAIGTLLVPLLLGAILIRHFKTANTYQTLHAHRTHRTNLRKIS